MASLKRFFLFTSMIVTCAALAQNASNVDLSSCPYKKGSDDADNMVASLSSVIDGAIQNIKEKKQEEKPECLSKWNDDLIKVSAVVDSIVDQVRPPKKAFASLLISSGKINCGSSVGSIRDFLDTYIQNITLHSYNLLPLEDNLKNFEQLQDLSGDFGNEIDDNVKSCIEKVEENHRDEESGKVDVEKNDFLSIVYDCMSQKIFGGSPYGGALPATSALYLEWSNEDTGCGGDFNPNNISFTDVQSLLVDEDQEESARTLMATGLEGVLKEVSRLSTNLLNQEANPDCSVGSNTRKVVGNLVNTAFSVTAAVGQPFGSLATMILGPIIHGLINRIGNGQSQINKWEKLKESLDDNEDKLYEDFACQLQVANKSLCETIMRSELAIGAQPTCGNLSGMGSNLSKWIKDVSKVVLLEEPKEGEPFENIKVDEFEQAEKIGSFYNTFFEPKVSLPNQVKVSMYDFLFEEPQVFKVNGEEVKLGGLLKGNAELYLPEGSASSVKIAAKARVDKLKFELDRFRKSYRDAEKNGDFSNLYKEFEKAVSIDGAFAKIMSGESLNFKSILSNHFRNAFKENNKVNQNMMNAIAGGISRDAYHILGDGIPGSFYENSDMLQTLRGNVYPALIGKGTGKEFQMVPALAQERFKKNICRIYGEYDGSSKKCSYDDQTLKDVVAKEGVKNPITFFDGTVYPLMRDCLMGYLWGVQGDNSLSPDYKKMCGFLSHCNGFNNNTIGLPVDFNINQGLNIINAQSVEDIPFCPMANNFDLIVESARKEIRESFAKGEAKLCGRKIDQNFFSMKQ
ncbi:MAG: hypothetical protein H6620_10930 [Halobacteriovoraceae bacterium]|nr:hypothetical protein [Halobacteriovoraceae bacterium]